MHFIRRRQYTVVPDFRLVMTPAFLSVERCRETVDASVPSMAVSSCTERSPPSANSSTIIRRAEQANAFRRPTRVSCRTGSRRLLMEIRPWICHRAMHRHTYYVYYWSLMQRWQPKTRHLPDSTLPWKPLQGTKAVLRTIPGGSLIAWIPGNRYATGRPLFGAIGFRYGAVEEWVLCWPHDNDRECPAPIGAFFARPIWKFALTFVKPFKQKKDGSQRCRPSSVRMVSRRARPRGPDGPWRRPDRNRPDR